MSTRRHLRIGSIPVHVEWPFFLIAAMLGTWGMDAWPGSRFEYIAVWVAIVFVSVLVHELGHAVAYRAYGQRPKITLAAFWGLTEGERELSRGRSIIVSLSGAIAAMLVLGVPAMALRSHVTDPKLFNVVYDIGFINVWWSVANLLPLLPLDGGNITQTIWGLRTARIASLVTGVVVALWLYVIGYGFAAVFIGMLALMNLGEAMQEGIIGRGGGGSMRYDPPPRPSSTPKSKRSKRRKPPLTLVPPPSAAKPVPTKIAGARTEAAAWDALRADDVAAAAAIVDAERDPSPYLKASVAACQDRNDEALELFASAFARNPNPPNLLVSKLISRADLAVPLATRLLDDPTVDVEAISELQNHLHYADAFADAAQVGELLVADGRRSVAQSSYEVACSWARAGRTDDALRWLSSAVDAGFTATRVIEAEDDLAEVRKLPGYETLLSRLRLS